MESISAAVNLLTFFSFLLLFKNEVQKTIKELFDHAKPASPPEQRGYFFYLLFFWAVVASLLGGLFWNVAFQGTLGGSREPHGWAAVLWAVVTNLPVIVALIVINNRFSIGIQSPVQLYAAFLIGSVIGSGLFYDLPLFGEQGFRNYVETKNLTYHRAEFWLVVIWSSLLSVTGFVCMGLANFLVNPPSRKFGKAAWVFLKQSALSVGLTASAVSLFIWAFADPARYEAARGVIAGLFLRITIFFGLFLGSYVVKEVTNKQSSKRKKPKRTSR